MDCEETLYAIREVSELTGIKPVTLRAWQRRYNIIQPQRTEKGHRLYTRHHIQQIKSIQGWLEKGVAIGKVKALLESGSEVVDLDTKDDLELLEVESMLGALAVLNRSKAESILTQVFKEYPLDLLQRRFIKPIYDAIALVKRSQKNLQLGMFQSIVLFRLCAILEAENKVARRGRGLVVSYDDLGSIEMRLWALRVAEQGHNISFIEGVEDASALLDSAVTEQYELVCVFASQAPPQGQLDAIQALARQRGNGFTSNPLVASLIQLEG